jgi:hypothetical protein
VESLSDKISVRQANALAKSGQELDLIEKRLLLIAMSRISRKDTELLTHRIYVSEINEYFGGDPWRAAQKAATGLLRRVVHVKGDDGGFTAFQWTTLAKYVPASRSEEGSSYIEIRLNQELAPLLLQLKERYNTIPLLELLPIPSVNSQRLYEVLWHDSHGGKKQFLTYDLSNLKFLLGLRVLRNYKGKESWEEKYRTWRDFQKVLKRAQIDFKEYGTLRFSFDGIARGRTTTQVRFCITLAHPSNLPELPIDAPTDPALDLRKLQLTHALDEAGYLQDALQAIDTYGLEVVEMALKLSREAERKAAKSKNPVANLGGLIHHSLKTGLAQRRLERAGQDNPEPATDPKALARLLIDAFDNGRKQFAQNLWDSMRLEDQDGFSGIMRLELSQFQLDQLDKVNWKGPAFEVARNQLLLLLHEDELPEHLSDIEAFMKGDGLFAGYEAGLQGNILHEAKTILVPSVMSA